MPDLFGDEEDNCEEELKINKGYANHYNDWRQKEELNKCNENYYTLLFPRVSYLFIYLLFFSFSKNKIRRAFK